MVDGADRKKPQPEGAVPQTEGAIQQPDGAIQQPDGAIQQPDGAIQQPEGAIHQPDGVTQLPDSAIPQSAVNSAPSQQKNSFRRVAKTLLEQTNPAPLPESRNIVGGSALEGPRKLK